ncbi:hypothetical protein JYT61_01330 [bacterium AH-315-E10]|nr:hypothetical protein [bacterium AH-315-E10]
MASSPIWGRSYNRITAKNPSGSLILDINVNQVDDYNNFKEYYSNGILKAEGMCYVQWSGDQIIYYNSWLKWAKYYKPDGSLNCEVIEGSGIQRYWHPNGQLLWELTLQKNKRIKLKVWSKEGKLTTERIYLPNKRIHIQPPSMVE